MTTETLTVPAVTPLEPTTPIKPSEALRLGRLSFPERVTGEWFDGKTGACALGAITAGWGYDDYNGCVSPEAVLRLWDLLGGEPVGILGYKFDDAEWDGRDGDAAVLAFLEELGL